MKIFTHVSAKDSAITYYRSHTPLNSLEDMAGSLGEVIEVTVDDFHPATHPDLRLHAFSNADLVQVTAALAVQIYPEFDKVHKAIPEWHKYTGEVIASPAFVIDADDLYTEVDYLNPAYSYWGIKRPDGTPLCVGDKITIDTVDAGEMPLWEDGKYIEYNSNNPFKFNVTANHARMATFYTLMDQAKLMTVSTPVLKREYEKLGRKGPIHVYPNSIVPEEFPDVPLEEHSGVRVLWQGGYSHHADLYEIRESLGRLSAKYPYVKWVFFGQMFSFIMNAIPEDRREYIKWVPYTQHRMRMATIPHDIALCPIQKTLFNEGKSAIKWYESSLRLKPAATIARNWGPFRDEMTDGETGMLYDTPEEFEQKMGILIENTRLRKTLGENAKKWVIQNRHARDSGRALYEVYKETVARHLAESRRPITPKKVNTDGLLSAYNDYVGAG